MGQATARLFDAMAEEYDVLEPWYQHLYAAIHRILLDTLLPPRAAEQPRALDAGCGTGFQAALLERLGYETHGVDIAPRLLAVARRRLPPPRWYSPASRPCRIETRTSRPSPAVAARSASSTIRAPRARSWRAC